MNFAPEQLLKCALTACSVLLMRRQPAFYSAFERNRAPHTGRASRRVECFGAGCFLIRHSLTGVDLLPVSLQPSPLDFPRLVFAFEPDLWTRKLQRRLLSQIFRGTTTCCRLFQS